ncbi:MAG: glycosyltransferase family 2 protein, partial [Planctomycetia bacterium]|nr:glycosyltransferase family 2 protein [Planctomycetia bacterium]
MSTSSSGTGKFSVSVAICTYNSGRFLAEELESIAEQTVLPTEVVVCDDGSTDETLTILEMWRKSVPFPVKIYQNAENLGYTKNFEKAVSTCSGEIILLADHDDVWMPTRVEVVCQAFSQDAELALVTSDAQIIDADGMEQGMSLREFVTRMHLHDFWHFFFPDDVEMVLWTGCTMALRREFLPVCLPIPEGMACHDIWFYMAMALSARIAFLPEPLLRYRLHGKNNSTAPTVAFLRKNPSQWRYFNAFLDTLYGEHTQLFDALEEFSQKLPDTVRKERFLRQLRCHRRHFSARHDVPRKPMNLIREMLNGGYFTHPQPILSWLY